MKYQYTNRLSTGSGWNHRIWNQGNRRQILSNIMMHGELLLAQSKVSFVMTVSSLIFSPAVSSFQAALVSAASKD
jgi:hypothetical protein